MFSFRTPYGDMQICIELRDLCTFLMQGEDPVRGLSQIVFLNSRQSNNK